jgi:hypothetical protein
VDNEALHDDTRGRDRTHLYPGRARRLTPRFTVEEREELEAAARAVGMTPTGFLAEAGLAYARQTRPARLEPVREQLRLLQLDLFQTRTITGRIAANLDQALAMFQAAGHAPAWLEQAAQSCVQRLAALDEVINQVDGHLR